MQALRCGPGSPPGRLHLPRAGAACVLGWQRCRFRLIRVGLSRRSTAFGRRASGPHGAGQLFQNGRDWGAIQPPAGLDDERAALIEVVAGPVVSAKRNKLHHRTL